MVLEKAKAGQSIFDRAMASAVKGGFTGAAAQAVNVLALMWLRTTMNYQMANGAWPWGETPFTVQVHRRQTCLCFALCQASASLSARLLHLRVQGVVRPFSRRSTVAVCSPHHLIGDAQAAP